LEVILVAVGAALEMATTQEKFELDDDFDYMFV
jgi:hypothetical protein